MIIGFRRRYGVQCLGDKGFEDLLGAETGSI